MIMKVSLKYKNKEISSYNYNMKKMFLLVKYIHTVQKQ